MAPKAQVQCPCGGTGRRARLKIVFRKEWGFNSLHGHQDFIGSTSPFTRCAMFRGRTKTVGPLACRIAVGTGVYVVIVVLATPLPPAAGLMLTFPALNGLAFYFSEDARAASIAKTMFWMPIVNGALCAGYILLFLLLAKTISPTALGWGLLLVEAVLWFAWVTRRHVRAGIDRSSQLTFGIFATLAGAALAAATMLVMIHFGISPPELHCRPIRRMRVGSPMPSRGAS